MNLIVVGPKFHFFLLFSSHEEVPQVVNFDWICLLVQESGIFLNLTLSPDIITLFLLLLKLSKAPLLFYIGLVLFVPDPVSKKFFLSGDYIFYPN